MKALFVALLAALLPACIDFKKDLDTCRAIGRCEAQTTCPYPAFPLPTSCGNDRDLYLAPTGINSNPGTADFPRRTLDGLPLQPGDRIHLAAGTWDGGLKLEGNGRSDCPITVDGAPDQRSVFLTTVSDQIHVRGSHWRVSDLKVECDGFAGGSCGIAVSSGSPLFGVVVQKVVLRALGGVQTLAIFEGCEGCALIASRFEGIPGAFVSNAAQAWNSHGFVFRGNRLEVESVQSLFQAPGSTAVLIEANEFIGEPAVFFQAAGGRFVRNLVRDVPSGLLVQGAAQVTRNTFARVGTATAADVGEFSNNIVWIGGTGYGGQAPADGGYNLFNTVKEYGTGPVGPTDWVALPKLGPDFVPTAESPAVDAADPSLQVPPGGAARADIGAFERGSLRREDGRYCQPDDGGT